VAVSGFLAAGPVVTTDVVVAAVSVGAASDVSGVAAGGFKKKKPVTKGMAMYRNISIFTFYLFFFILL
jgi:hypothetical protein